MPEWVDAGLISYPVGLGKISFCLTFSLLPLGLLAQRGISRAPSGRWGPLAGDVRSPAFSTTSEAVTLSE